MLRRNILQVFYIALAPGRFASPEVINIQTYGLPVMSHTNQLTVAMPHRNCQNKVDAALRISARRFFNFLSFCATCKL
jgi:hypothetical protein